MGNANGSLDAKDVDTNTPSEQMSGDVRASSSQSSRSNGSLTLRTVMEHEFLQMNESHNTTVGIQLIAGPSPEANTRAPVDCMVVCDVSGSMDGQKIDLVRKTIVMLVDELAKCDRVGIVSFGDNASVVQSINVFMNENGKQATKRAATNLRIDGCTALDAGLQLGLRSFEPTFASSVTSLFGSSRTRRASNPISSFLSSFTASPSTRSASFSASTPPPPVDTSNDETTLPSEPTQQQEQQEENTTVDETVETPNKSKMKVRTCLLLTDGQPNRGESDPAQIVKNMKASLPSGVSVHTFGYGADHNANLMRSIAEGGGGSYYFVKDNDEIKSAFGDCLGGVLSVVAQNIEVEVSSSSPGVRINAVHHQSARCVEEGRRYVVPFSDLYGEEERDVLVDVTVDPSTSPSQQDLITCTLKFVDIIAQSMSSSSTTASVNRPTSGGRSAPNPHIVMHRTRVDVASSLEQAKRDADNGRLTQARATITRAKQQARDAMAVCKGQNGAQTMFQSLVNDLEECERNLESQSQWRSAGTYVTSKMAQSHYAQRCQESSSITPSVYRTSAKQAMSTKFSGF